MTAALGHHYAVSAALNRRHHAGLMTRRARQRRYWDRLEVGPATLCPPRTALEATEVALFIHRPKPPLRKRKKVAPALDMAGADVILATI